MKMWLKDGNMVPMSKSIKMDRWGLMHFMNESGQNQFTFTIKY